MNVGTIISEHRKKKGLTQKELAELLHVTPQAVSNWEKNKRLPDLAFLPELKRILDVRYDEIIGDQDLRTYSEEQKEQLLQRCIDCAHVANKLCAMLDLWEREDKEIRKKENEELLRRGVDINNPLRSAADIDPLGIADEIIMKKKVGLDLFIKQYGKTNMAYVAMILYLGEDLAHGSWNLPLPSDPDYKNSVCELLLTDQQDYNRLSNPYYEIEEKVPALVASWIRKGLDIMIKAV